MKRICICLLALLGTRISYGQFSIPVVYSGMFEEAMSNQFPSLAADQTNGLEIETGLNFVAGSRGVPFGTVNQFVFDQTITADELRYYFVQLEPKNIITAGLDAQDLAVGIRLGAHSPGSGNFTLNFGIRDRVSASAAFTENLVSLILDGNAQFAGEITEIDVPNLTALYFREYSIGGSATIFKFPVHGMKNPKLMLGARLKYLSGLAMIQMPQDRATIYTDPDGRYIDVYMNEALYYAGIQTRTDEQGIPIPQFSANPLDYKQTGTGIAGDLGATLNFGDKNTVSIGVTDLGAIAFHQVNSYLVNGDFRFEGLDVDNVMTDIASDTLNNISNFLTSSTGSGETYKPKLPTTINAQYSRDIDQSSFSKKFSKGTALLTMSRAFQTSEQEVSPNFFSIGYAIRYLDKSSFGSSLAFGGYDKMGLGLFAATHFGAFKVGLGTSDILPIFSKGTSAGTTLSLHLGFGG